VGVARGRRAEVRPGAGHVQGWRRRLGDRWGQLGNGRIGRFFEGRLLHGRDYQLVQALDATHAERQHEPAKIAVVFGAAHIPAAVDHLTEKLGYYVENAEWLIVAHAPS